MNTSQYQITVFIVLALIASPAFSATDQSSAVDAQKLSHRADRKIGAYIGILGDPAPTVVGINAAYNVADYLRANVGFGQVSSTTSISITNSGVSTEESSMTTLGVGVKALMPGWNFTPTLGLGFSHVFGDLFSEDFASNNLYGNVGVDWQTKIGLNLGAGLNVGFAGLSGALPYVNVGWYL